MSEKYFLSLTIVRPDRKVLLIKKNSAKFWELPCGEICIGQAEREVAKVIMERTFSARGAKIGGVVFLGARSTAQEHYHLIKVILQYNKPIRYLGDGEARWLSEEEFNKPAMTVELSTFVLGWVRPKLQVIFSDLPKPKNNYVIYPEAAKITKTLLKDMEALNSDREPEWPGDR